MWLNVFQCGMASRLSQGQRWRDSGVQTTKNHLYGGTDGSVRNE